MNDIFSSSSIDFSAAIAVGTMLGLVILGVFGFRENPLQGRLDTFERKEKESKDGKSESRSASLLAALDNVLPWQKFFLWCERNIDAEKILGKKETIHIRGLLTSAGWRSFSALILFVFCKIAMFVIFGITMIVGVFGFGWFAEWPVFAHVGMVVGGMFVGGMIPENFLKKYASRRMERIRSFIPDVTDMMIVCLRSGLGLEDTLNRVWLEIVRFAPDLSDELHVTALEYRMLEDRVQAMRNFAKRIDIEEIHMLVMTTVQAEKYGTSMSDAMSVMADESRKKRISRAEAWATRVPVLMTLPLVAFLMPVFMILIAGPAISNISSVFDQL